MRTPTATLAQRAALALKNERLYAELKAQRAIFEHIIVAIDNHELQLQKYRILAPLFGIKN